MYRLSGIFLLSVFLLAGCQTDKDQSSATPEEALYQLHFKKSYAKPSEIYQVLEIGKGRVLAVYKGEMDDEENMYVANIESDNGKWLVTDAISIGMPSADKLNQSSVTDRFAAGYTTDEISSSEDIRIVECKDCDFNIWVELFN